MPSSLWLTPSQNGATIEKCTVSNRLLLTQRGYFITGATEKLLIRSGADLLYREQIDRSTALITTYCLSRGDF